jgi:putative endonuclease
MNFYCYILYSPSLRKYYVGSTSEPVIKRLEQHNNSFYGDRKYTHKTNDWEIYYFIECTTRKQAELIEKHIKSMKSRKYILNLKLYPSLALKLLQKYY